MFNNIRNKKFSSFWSNSEKFFNYLQLAYTFDAGPNCFLLMEDKSVSLVSAIIQECFLKDKSIRFGSAEKLEIPENFDPLLSNFDHCKGTVAYAIESGVGSGPKIIKPKTPLN